MLDQRVRTVLARLEAEDAADGEAGLPREVRSLPVGSEAGRVLFALAAAVPGCRVLEIGSSRGYSTLWLAAGARAGGGSVVSLESDPAKVAIWTVNLAEAGLGATAALVEGDARASLGTLPGPFDIVLLDAWKRDYEELFSLARPLVRPGGSFVSDNVTSHDLSAFVAARQSDPTLSTVTLPVGSGLELTTVLT